jgi:Ca2+-binding RTX toxin-like protein
MNIQFNNVSQFGLQSLDLSGASIAGLTDLSTVDYNNFTPNGTPTNTRVSGVLYVPAGYLDVTFLGSNLLGDTINLTNFNYIYNTNSYVDGKLSGKFSYDTINDIFSGYLSKIDFKSGASAGSISTIYNYTGTLNFATDGTLSGGNVTSYNLVNNGNSATFSGNVSIDASGVYQTGVINSVSFKDSLNNYITVSNVNIDYKQFEAALTGSTNFNSLYKFLSSSANLTGNDTITADANNNLLTGYAGNDTLAGGAGSDTAVYAGAVAGYKLSYSAGVVSVQDTNLADGNEGTDKLSQIENIKFANKNIKVDGLSYIASNADLIKAFGLNAEAGLNHLFSAGLQEGRQSNFDGLLYTASYGDLIRAFGSNSQAATQHYITAGFNEGRKVSFDGLNYIASYGDLIGVFKNDALAGTQHYITAGFNEGRKATFDGLKYVASYADLMNAFGTNGQAGTEHYISNGFTEGRKASFDAQWYLAKYGDIRNAFGINETSATTHYINNGRKDGHTYNTAANDVLKGGTGADKLNGYAGNDTITGGAGNDVINGGAGADSLTGGTGNDTFSFNLVGAENVDFISDFTSGQDKISLFGTAFSGALSAGVYTDMYVNGTAALDGNDFIIYNQATGELFFDADANGVNTQQLIANLVPNTTLFLSDFIGAQNTIQPGQTITGTGILTGGSGNDTIIAGAGNDTLDGGAGNDVLTGGQGSDMLTGGLGADRFVYNSDAYGDVITDFNSFEFDKIDLSAIDANTNTAVNDAFIFVTNFTNTIGEVAYDPGTFVIIGDSNGDGIADLFINMWGISTMSASDFIL